MDLLESNEYIRFDDKLLGYCITQKSKKILKDNNLLGKTLDGILEQKIEVFDGEFFNTYRPKEN